MGSPFLQVQGACEETAHPRDRGLEEKPDCGFGLTICTCIRISLILIYVLLRVKILTLETIGYSLDICVEHS